MILLLFKWNHPNKNDAGLFEMQTSIWSIIFNSSLLIRNWKKTLKDSAKFWQLNRKRNFSNSEKFAPVNSKFAGNMTSKYGFPLSRLANNIREFPFRLLTYALLVCFLRTSHMFFCRRNVFDLSIWPFCSRLWLISGFVRRENAGCTPVRIWKTLKKPMAWKFFAKFTHTSSAAVRVKQGSERYTRCKFPRWRFTSLKSRHSHFMFMFLIFPDSGQLVSLSRMWNVLQPSSLVPFVRLFWLLYRKPAYSPSRTINWALSRYGTWKVVFKYFGAVCHGLLHSQFCCSPLLF